MSKRAREFVKSKTGQSSKRKMKLAQQKKSLNKSKIAAARVIANAATAGFLGIEKKFYDTYLADTAVGAATALTGGAYDPSATSMISTPAQGDGEQNRDGKRIVIDSLILKGHVINPGGTADNIETAQAPKVFVAVVLDTQSNAAQMQSEDCFKNTAASASLNCAPLKNLLSGKRFRILKSHVFDLTVRGPITAAATQAANTQQQEFDWYIPFKGGLPVNFNAGTTSTIANVVDNSLHVVAFANVTGCSIGYNARIRFQG